MNKSESTSRRLIRGSTIAWVRLGTGFGVQLIVTPVFLAFWSAKTYGIWLAIVAAASLIQIPGLAHQQYVGYELMKTVTGRQRAFTRILRSAAWLGAAYGVLELLMACALSAALIVVLKGHGNQTVTSEAGWAFIAMTAGSSLVWNWGGVWVNAAYALGYFPRTAVWGVGDALIRGLAPLIVLPFGAGILGAAVFLMTTLLALHLACLFDMMKIIRPYLGKQSARSQLGIHNFIRSQLLSIRMVLEMARQQGARLILVPLAGTEELAAFATMRTGANAALQGLGSITSPLMPELMRFLNQRDQARTEAAFSTVWIVVVAAMTPSVILLQVIVAPLFRIWTHGKIQFDPVLFALLSLGVLVYAMAQPAMAVVQGNNLLRPQLLLSGLAGGVVVGGMVLLVPKIGICGAGWSLLMGEIVAAIGYVKEAAIWLNKNNLHWPEKAFNRVILSVLAAGIAMFGIALFPKFHFVFLALGLVALTIIFVSYWRHLPQLAKQKMAAFLIKLPGGRRLAAALA
jgi:O-antigen/teichoic acid export membrane protein